MSSTSEYLPKPDPSKEHEHRWEDSGERVLSWGVTLAVYLCRYCGARLQRGPVPADG